MRSDTTDTGGVHMICENYKQSIIEIVNDIEDEETLLFLLEILKRIKD